MADLYYYQLWILSTNGAETREHGILEAVV